LAEAEAALNKLLWPEELRFFGDLTTAPATSSGDTSLCARRTICNASGEATALTGAKE
jgi:hypothetical protein